jgi:hypothetical protein
MRSRPLSWLLGVVALCCLLPGDVAHADVVPMYQVYSFGRWPDFFHNAGYANGYWDSWSFRVQGKHYYYDTSTTPPTLGDLGTTQITNNCDLNNWGWYGENDASI